jgi:hypothetical protein
MKFAFAILVSSAVLAIAAPQEKKSTTTPAAPPKRLEIPAGAVEREPNRFFSTDTDGKKWIYVRTPMGVSRIEDKGPDPTKPAKQADPLLDVKVTEQGDMVKFERPGAFGLRKWEKKKSDLDEQETAALHRSQQERSSASHPQDAPAKQDR